MNSGGPIFSNSCKCIQLAAGLLGMAICANLLVGCARYNAPVPALSQDEKGAIADEYEEIISQTADCPQFEADVMVRFSSFFKDAALSGVLLARNPQSMKFIGTNPFGQPLVLFLLNDQVFLLVDVPSQKAFEGTSRSSKVEEVFPFEKLQETSLYSLLRGAHSPGRTADAVMREEGLAPDAYLLLWRTASGGEQRVVFDMHTRLVESYELLDEHGSTLLRILYPQHKQSGCCMPSSIHVSGQEVRGRIELTLEHAEVTSSLTDADFKISLPTGYQVETVR